MRRFLFLFLLTISCSLAFGQEEKSDDRVVAGQFKAFYNADATDSIHRLFSVRMQQALPLEKANVLLSGLKAQVGTVKKMEFSKYAGPYATYRTTFDKGVFAVEIALDQQKKIDGFFIKPITADESIPRPARNVTRLQLPFKDEWTVVWGGDTEALNYHVENTAQKNAFDMVIMDKGAKTHKKTGKENGDYYAYGKALFSPCDGEIIEVIDGIPDNEPGKMNEKDVTGNMVILKTVNNEYLFFAHFKQQSIKVRKGQTIKAGELLGLAGNSGRSSEPHLHFHMQNNSDLLTGTGIKAYFYEIKVNGKLMRDYTPVQKDIIGPVN